MPTSTPGSVSADPSSTEEAGRLRPRSGAWRRLRRHRPALVGLTILALELTIAMAAPALIPEEAALQPNPTRMLQTPSAMHPLGTDEVGRDLLARLVYAARISLAVGVLTAVVAVTLGTGLGAIAGYYGGWADTVIMRITDALLSIPVMFFVIVLTVVLGPNPRTLIVVIGVLSWIELARIIRANFLSLKHKEFAECARAVGVGDVAIMFRHILPNTLAPTSSPERSAWGKPCWRRPQ